MFKNKFLLAIIVLFIVSRFLGLGQLYHQDEYHWVDIYGIAAHVDLQSASVAAPHPPLILGLFYIFSIFVKIFNYSNLRLIPLFFGILCFLPIYLLSIRTSDDRRITYIAIGLLTMNIYSLIADLMLDIDGTIMPFFVLLSYYFYLRWVIDKDRRFALPFIAAIAGGLLSKEGFTLFVATLAVDYLWIIYKNGDFKVRIKRFIYLFGGLVLLSGAFYAFYGSSHPGFANYMLTHLKTIKDFSSRSYFDLFLRLFKFFIWLSPLLTLPVIYGIFKKEIFNKYRVWYIYIVINLLFYLVIFNFSTLPIERYLMAIIIPAVFISSDVIYSLTKGLRINKKYLLIGIAAFVALVAVTVLIKNEVIPLNPKEAYVDKLKALDFNFLIPLTGGSGPIGFYASAQFILWTWIICAAGLFFNKKAGLVYLFLVFGLGYNIFLSNEFLFGNSYGSVDKITKQSVDYVIKNKDIKDVITYYDAGVYYLKAADKYNARFYTAPTRDYSIRINAYRGYYMIVDFPAIDKKSQYWRLISRCKLEQKFTDKYVDSYIFDCRSLPVVTPLI